MKPQPPSDQQKSESRSVISNSTNAPKTLNVCGVSVSCTHAEGPPDQPSLVSKPKVRLFASEGNKASSQQSRTLKIDKVDKP